jgi:hypothetical protein
VWIEDDGEARANPLRLDRRAWWRRTGASPFGFGFRGQLSQDEDDRYWLYDALGVRIWVHRDNEQAPQRPLVFVLQMTGEDLQQRRRLGPTPDADVAEPPVLRWVQHRGPAPASIPRYDGPQITFSQGPHRLELVAGHGPPQRLSDILTVGGGE